MQRYHWILNRNDYGSLYYLQTMLDNNDNQKLLSYLQDKINFYKKELNGVQNNFIKNKSIENSATKCKFKGYEAKLITEINIKNNYIDLEFVDKNKYYVFYNLELYELYYEKGKNKLTKVENIEPKSKLLVGHEIWEYDKNKWIYNSIYSPYEKLKYVCEFNNIDIQNIELDSLDCIYKKDTGCNSKTYMRFNKKINTLTTIIDDFQKLEKSIKENTLKKEIDKRLHTIIEKYYYQGSFKKVLDKKLDNSKKSKSKGDSRDTDTNKDVNNEIQDNIHQKKICGLLRKKNLKGLF